MEKKEAFIIEDGILLSYLEDEAVVTIPEGVVSVSANAFQEKRKMKKIVFPSSLRQIGGDSRHGVFDFCDALQTIVFQNGLEVIGPKAFYQCRALQTIEFPNTLKEIQENAFSQCFSLNSITIPDSVRIIGANAFSGCNSLISIKLPQYTKIIPHGAFHGCSALENVTLPDGLEQIDEYAFCSTENRFA